MGRPEVSAPRPDSSRSWGVVAVAFVAMFAATGVGYAYGALLLHLIADVGITPGLASGVFSVTILVFFMVGAPAGMLADRDGPRRVLLGGAVAIGAGLLLTSAARGPGALFLGHGLLVGVGMATAFVPLVSAVAQVFDRHRSAAMGVAVSGIGVGTLVMAPVVAWLIEAVGWRGTYAGLGLGTAAVLAACALLLPGRAGHQPSARIAGRTAPSTRAALRSRSYGVLYAAQVLLALALFLPFALLPAYAQSVGMPPVPAAGLVGLLGLASVAGRLLLGVLARRIGVVACYRGCYLLVGLSFALWLLPGDGHPSLAVFAVAFGLGYGGFVALLPSVVAELFGLTRFGTLTGVLYTANALGAGAGPWLAGALVGPYGFLPAGVIGVVGGTLGFAVLGLLERRRTGAAAAS